MQLYRNIGVSDIRRPNGEVVGPDQVFEPTEKEVAQMADLMWIGIRVSEVTSEEAVTQLNEAVETVDTAQTTMVVNDPNAGRQWTLKVSPEDYLKRHPEGPQAALARSILTSATVSVSE